MQRISLAIVGLRFGSRMADTMLKSPANHFVQLAALCDKDPALLQAATQRTGLPGFSDLDTLLANPTIEAIALFTGPNNRAALIRRIIRVGKHVLTTKPFERDPDAALQILLEAQKLGRVVHLNSPAPELSADLRQIRIWQNEHTLGRIIGCRRSVWASYHEQADGTWYDDPALCPVAPIFRLGIYAINDLVRLLGPADKVQVLHSRLLTGRPTPDNAQLGILFKSGAIANIYASFCINDGQFYRNSLTLNFENGTIFRNVGPLNPETAHHKATMQLVTGTGFSVQHPVADTAGLDDVSGDYQWEAFVKAIRGEPLHDQVTPEQIVAGLRIIGAMARAEKSGATETVG